MTCREMDGAIGSTSGDMPLPREAAQHVVECESCRLLVNALDKGHNSLEPSRGRLKQIQTTINEDLTAVRPLASSSVLLLAFMLTSLVVVVTGSLLMGMRGWGALSKVQGITVFAALTSSVIFLAISLASQMAPGGKHSISPLLLPIGILALLILVTTAIFHVRHESAFVLDGLACLRTGLTYSVPAALVIWALLSRGAILYPKLTGAAAGGLAGVIGLGVLEVGCSNLSMFHILVWHLGVILVCTLGGILLGATVEFFRGRGMQT